MGGSTTRQNCKWIPFVQAESDETGGKYTNYDHPDLLRALRGLDDFEKWVSLRLIPIVGKWIDENREEVIKDLTDEEMNDMGAAVEAAYKIIEKSTWMKERLKAAEKIDAETISLNPLWRKQTNNFITAEKDVKNMK